MPLLQSSFGGEYPQPWRDTMQVCLSGHVINRSCHSSPLNSKEYCDKCGEKTITSCQSCGKSIPGSMQNTGVKLRRTEIAYNQNSYSG